MRAAEQRRYYVSDNDVSFLSNMKRQLCWSTGASHCWKKNACFLNTFDWLVCRGENVALTACAREVRFHPLVSSHPSPIEYFLLKPQLRKCQPNNYIETSLRSFRGFMSLPSALWEWDIFYSFYCVYTTLPPCLFYIYDSSGLEYVSS